MLFLLNFLGHRKSAKLLTAICRSKGPKSCQLEMFQLLEGIDDDDDVKSLSTA